MAEVYLKLNIIVAIGRIQFSALAGLLVAIIITEKL